MTGKHWKGVAIGVVTATVAGVVIYYGVKAIAPAFAQSVTGAVTNAVTGGAAPAANAAAAPTVGTPPTAPVQTPGGGLPS
jgi:hypothetical protein